MLHDGFFFAKAREERKSSASVKCLPAVCQSKQKLLVSKDFKRKHKAAFQLLEHALQVRGCKWTLADKESEGVTHVIQLADLHQLVVSSKVYVDRPRSFGKFCQAH